MQKQMDFRIDYLQFSHAIIPHWMVNSVEDYSRQSAKPFYKRMTRYTSGAERHTGNPNSEKALYILSGSACESLGVERIFVNSVIESGGKISRCDFAMTTNEPILEKLWDDREHIQSIKYSDCKLITDSEKAIETMYFGDMKNRGRKGIIRAYNKALELGLDEIRHRIEYEAKHQEAHLQARRFSKGNSIPEIINSRFSVDREWWREIFGNGVAVKRFTDVTENEPTEIQRKMAWLEKQVIPALQYVIDYDKANGTENMTRILEQLKF